MPTTNTSFSALIAAIDSKAQSLASSTTDPKDLVFLGKAIEAMNTADTVSAIIDEGDTQVSAVNTAGTTQVNNVNTAGTNQVAAVQAAGASYATQANVDNLIAEITVTVANSKFVIDGTAQKAIRLTPSVTYRFDTSDASNAGHPLKFSTTADGTHASPAGTEFTTGVTTVGTAGSANSYVQIIVEQDSPTLYYYCANHSGMGGTAYSAYDVLSTTPSDGQVLTYDAVTSAYVNRDASSGGGSAIQLGHAVGSYSTEDVLLYGQNNYSSDLYIKNDGVHSIQTSKQQFGYYGMFVSPGSNQNRCIGVPFQVNQSTGAITSGTPVTLTNSTGTAVSTTIAGDAGIGVGAIVGRQHYNGSYVVQYWVTRFDIDNTANMARGNGSDYNTSQMAHPQVGWVGVLGNPVRGDDFSQTTGIFAINGYGGSNGGIAADVVLDINIGSSSGSNPSVANSGQGTNWSTGESDTSTSGGIVADYLYTDTFDRIMFASARYKNNDWYKIFSSSNNSTITRSSGVVRMPGESHYDRSKAQALAFTNGYHAIFSSSSGHYHLYNTSNTKVGEGVLGVLGTGDSAVTGRYGTRRIGDNLFWVTGRYHGKAQIVNITVNTTTNKLEANELGTVNGTSDSAQYTAAYLSGANNEYLVIDSGMFNVAVYDIGSQLDLSAY